MEFDYKAEENKFEKRPASKRKKNTLRENMLVI